MAQFKKIGGKIFGVQLNKKEQEAMNKEINRQIAEREQQFFLDYDCMVLWTLHTQLGFGEKRLKRFYESFTAQHKELIDYYMCDSDSGRLCKFKLEGIGCDVEKWAEIISNGGTLDEQSEK